MEKRYLTFLVLSVLIILVWMQFFGPKRQTPPKEGEGTPTEQPAEPTGPKDPTEPKEPGATDSPAGPVAPESTAEPDFKRRVAGNREYETLDSPRVRWQFDSGGGGIARATLKEHTIEPGQDLEDPTSWYPVLSDLSSNHGRILPGGLAEQGDEVEFRSLAFRVIGEHGKDLELDEAEWTLEPGRGDRLVYALDLPAAGVRFTKTFALPDGTGGVEGGPLHLDFELAMTVTDLAKARKFGEKGLRIRLYGPASLPREPFDLEVRVKGAVLTTDVVKMEEVSAPGKPDSQEVEFWPKTEELGKNKRVEWVGLHSRFFTAILKARDPKELDAEFARFDPRTDKDSEGQAFANLRASMEFVLPFPEVEGGTVTREFLFYAGPMDPDLFGEGPYESFASIIDYGLLAFISKLLVLLLGAIQSVVSNWGVAIIILTLIVRMAMFPLSRKSQVSMQKYQKQMGRLKPKIDALKEKYQNNKKKLQEAQMKLMREEGVRMVPAGCLVIFLQMPIFIGLFQALRYAIGLRHENFLWVKDLTAPECIVTIAQDHGIPLLWDPFYLNILPILMGITWYLSAAMAPKATDPQQAQQQKMMKWMPVIFSLFLYNYASGLAIYMVVSSTWSIFEMKVVRKILAKPEEGPVAPAASPAFRKGK